MGNKIKYLDKYIEDILGTGIKLVKLPKQELNNLPMYMGVLFKLNHASLFNVDFLLIEYINIEDFSIFQLRKHFDLLKNRLNKIVVLLAEDLSSINRKRLIEKGINFIVPGKQMYLPDFLVDLREGFQNLRVKKKKEKLLPSAQIILLHHLLHKNKNKCLEEDSFSQLSLKFGYSKMAISKAVESLVYNKICTAEGSKEKHIRFSKNRGELWKFALPFCINPVFKKVYVDQKPQDIFLLHSNESALPEYSDMNPSRQKYFAIERTLFYELQKKGQLINPNEYEGRYCLELWKYNPLKLTEGITKKNNVDPLSLYLSLQDNNDERVESALEMITEKYIW